MILIDTSVWIAALRDADSNEAKSLGVLMDEDQAALAAPVRIEILAGAPARDQVCLRRLLSALPTWQPDSTTWDLIESWVGAAVQAGERFGLGDLLIGALGTQHGAPIWSLDQDFRRMARLGFVQIYSPTLL